MKTQVVIVGAGPAGLFLAHLLQASAIDCVVLERRDRAYVEGRVRAGVLEQGTVDLMHRLGVGARLAAEGLVHTGTNIVYDGVPFRVDMAALTGGAAVTVYGQQEVMKDLFDSAERRGIAILFDVADLQIGDVMAAQPTVRFSHGGTAHEVSCAAVAGCDGFHGPCRAAIPPEAITTYERIYPFGWLGILADVPPVNHELIYANHAHGFALASMRSPTRSRYYVQCSLADSVDDWPDARVWDEIAVRLGPRSAEGLVRGPSFEKSIAPLRSFVAAPMRFGRLFLAGDAAHIVPPTGAKGLNLAVSDVIMLAEALTSFSKTGAEAGLDGYSDRALARVWKAERFSWWFTSLTHRFPDMDGFARQMQIAELSYIRTSVAAQTTLAENYVGLPLDP